MAPPPAWREATGSRGERCGRLSAIRLEASAVTDMGNTRVLVVEDSAEMAGQLRRILEKRFPVEVELAPDCSTAREKLGDEAFDIVTLDFMLPDGTGLELLEEITSGNTRSRVIMITGHGDEEAAVRSFRSQASGYVIKDSHLAARLTEAVEKALVEVDLQRAQAELERREALFRSLAEKSSDVTTVMRADGTIVYESSSVERVLGYKPEDLLGKNAFDFIHPEDAGRVISLVEGAAGKPGALLVLEYRFRHKDGPWRAIESVGRNLLTDPVVSGIVVNSRDVTSRKRAELELDRYRKHLEDLVAERTAELAETNEQLRAEIQVRLKAEAELKERAEGLADFLTVASHELRHPISVVKGYTTMLEGYLERMEPEMLPDILRALDISVDRLTAYVDELLEASLVEQGRYTFHIEPCDLEPIIMEAVEDLRGLGVSNPVSVSISEDARRVNADPARVKRLMDMLIDNAVKFSEDGGEITILARGGEGVVNVRVIDRGMGIPAEVSDRVFDRFYQVEEISHHHSVGLGLGLFLAQRIVDAHGGTITHEPNDGGGTVFRFTLPVP